MVFSKCKKYFVAVGQWALRALSVWQLQLCVDLCCFGMTWVIFITKTSTNTPFIQ